MGKIIKKGVEYGGSSTSAGNVSYDNTGTDLSSTTVQNAITEIDAKTKLTDVLHFKGTTTTAIENGSTTNPITIDGESYTAVFGDVVVYNYTEFVFDGTTWSEFGRPFDTTPTSGSMNAVTSDGIYQIAHKGSGVSAVVLENGSSYATGEYGIASGYRNYARGKYSLCGGSYSDVSAAARCGLAFGDSCKSSATYAIAIGNSINANQSCLTAFGRYNSPRTGDLFNIGKGTNDETRSNILEANSTSLNVNGDIQKNGVSLPTPYTTMPTITESMLGQIAMYVGTTDANYTKGYFYIASSDGAAEPTYSWVSMVDTTPTSGSNNFVTSDGIYQRTPFMRGTGSNSAISPGCTATKASSVAFGDICNATGSISLATGRHTTASGQYSCSFNSYTTASGNYSSVFGTGTSATQHAMMAIGTSNKPRTGDLFNIGNGTGNDARSNIVEVNSTELNVNGDIKRNGVGIDDYSTTEQKIGKWIDGSDLYQRTFVVTGLTNGSWNNNVLGTSGISIQDVQGYVDWLYNDVADIRTSTDYFRADIEFVTTVVTSTKSDVDILPKIASSGYEVDKAVITIKYTKTQTQVNLMQMSPTEVPDTEGETSLEENEIIPPVEEEDPDPILDAEELTR